MIVPSEKPKSKVRFIQPKFLLPLTIVVGVLALGVRLDGVTTNLIEGRVSGARYFAFSAMKPAYAKAAEKKKEEPAAKAEEKKAEKTAEVKKEDAPEQHVGEGQGENLYSDDETDASILRQLQDRRAQLDKRAQALDGREALLKVAEQRVEQKIKEMEMLKGQVQSLVNTANATQQTQLDNLVKIYETMKAKEAARIFETLELPTLLGVLERMKPAKVALIMAEMAPEKAKDITVALTKNGQLPQVK